MGRDCGELKFGLRSVIRELGKLQNKLQKRAQDLQNLKEACEFARLVLGSIKGPHARDEAFQKGFIGSLRIIEEMINNFKIGIIP